MDVLQIVLRCVAAPAAVAAAVLVIAFWLARRSGRSWLRDAGEVLALGLGYLAGHQATIGSPPMPLSLSMEAMHWLGFVAVAAILVGLIEAFLPAPSWLRWLLRAGLVVLTVWLVANSLLDPQRDDRLSWPSLAAAILIALAFWANLQSLADRQAGRGVPLAIMVLAGSACPIILMAGIIVVAELAAALWFCTFAVLVAAWLDRGTSLARGGVTVVASLLIGLVLNGLYYGDLPPATAILMALAPAGLWLGRIGSLQRHPRWRATACSLAVLLPLVAALAITVLASPSFEGQAAGAAGEVE
ncbi:MAG TPA: hypothetical protein VGZ22_05245 [Isosphaeraceae bacterium]|jgi:hypothetical protein|nr:hypothetical protein [Isosphaeraceae bacterium]